VGGGEGHFPVSVVVRGGGRGLDSGSMRFISKYAV
jgi:hypothetical protein